MALGIIRLTFVFSAQTQFGRAIWGLAAYSALQFVPLPLGVFRILSPARAQLGLLYPNLLPITKTAPLAVDPPLAMAGVFSLLGSV